MDSISALSLSCDIIRFIKFAENLLSDTSDIFVVSSGTESPLDNHRLQAIHSQLASLATHLDDGLFKYYNKKDQPSDEKHATLEKYAIGCTQDCASLLRAVETLLHNEDKGPKYGKSFSAFFDQIVKQEPMESVKVDIQSLSSFAIPRMHLLTGEYIQHIQDQLGRINEDFGLFGGAQPSAFEKLQRSTGHLDQLAKAMPSPRLAPAAWERLCDKFAELSMGVQEFPKAIRILYRLDYPKRLLRQGRISEPHEGTFEWMSNHQDATETRDASASLRNWLSSDEKLFWVTGKAGSGKSTFMKFIADHQDARRLLETWAGHRELLAISHYFDINGTSTQKSLEGLLRSLICGIISAKPSLTTKLFLAPRDALLVQSSWTVSELESALSRMIMDTDFPVNVCFFIDGLDECQGDHAIICEQIENIAQFARKEDSPERKIRSSRLSHDLPKDLSGYISGKANGVFLWAVFATRLLLEGLFLHHRVFNRVQRVEAIPDELGSLLMLALESVDVSRQEKMAGALTIARDADQPLPAELFFFHDMGYDDDMFAFHQPTELLPYDSEQAQKLHLTVHQHLQRICQGVLEVSVGKVVFMHRMVSELMHAPNISDLLQAKIRRTFDLDLSLFKASIAWLKRTRFKRDEHFDSQPEPTVASLAFLQRLSIFHAQRGNIMPDILYFRRQAVDLFSMSKAVDIRGGFRNVCKYKVWSDVVHDLGYDNKTTPSASKSLMNMYEIWLYPYEEHLHQTMLGEKDPMDEIPDLVKSLRKIFEFARRCDQKGRNPAAVTEALLDNLEESLQRMIARQQFGMSNISMARGIYRHLVIESGIEGYTMNKCLSPSYFDNEYSQKHRSPICSALGVTPHLDIQFREPIRMWRCNYCYCETTFSSGNICRNSSCQFLYNSECLTYFVEVGPHFLAPAQLSSTLPNQWLLEKLLDIGHDPNKTHYGGETPWTAFIRTYVSNTTLGQLLKSSALGALPLNEISHLMLLHGANPEAYVDMFDLRSRTWRVPVWFKFLMLAPRMQSARQNTSERVFGMMLDGIPTLLHTEALLKSQSGDEVFEWVSYRIWKICTDNFELPRMPKDHSRSDAELLFKIFVKVCEKTLGDSEALDVACHYFSGCFWPDHPDLRSQILMFVPSNKSTLGHTTNSSFTPGENMESTSHQIATSTTSLESPENAEAKPEKDGGIDDDDERGANLDGEYIDDVASIQSVDDDIHSNTSSIVRTHHTIAAERQVGVLLARHPDVRFMLEESVEIMPKDRLKRNIRKSLKLLYLQLKEHVQDDVQMQVLTTRILRGRGSRTRISERTVNNEWMDLVSKPDNYEGDLRSINYKDRAFLDSWLSQIQPPERVYQKLHEDVQALNEVLDESENITSEEDDSSVLEDFQAMQSAKDFLMNGLPFQTFLTHLGLSLLPDCLRQIMHLATWDAIGLVYTPFDTALGIGGL
ncbi:hypothetical protein NW762_011826 [Fusarium torreyae]|uniref:ARID domain-containing protein n=1 Tax=Fusarium torreyae TaxID=1237075 RepID=A0A9W8RNQ3_9HYPO|nr:hypothetical protein NW762_011826 [Fusarium torreyae]